VESRATGAEYRLRSCKASRDSGAGESIGGYGSRARVARDLVMVGKKDPTGGPHGSVSWGGWVNVRATELWVPCDSQTSSMHAEGLAARARLSAWC
jgi:hypothetical protein